MDRNVIRSPEFKNMMLQINIDEVRTAMSPTPKSPS